MKLENYLNEAGKINKVDILKALKILTIFHDNDIKIQDWDGSGNYELETPMLKKQWFKEKDAVRYIFASLPANLI